MIKTFCSSESLRWHRIKKHESASLESLLRSQEALCVAACGKFLKRGDSGDQMWVLRDKAGGISALIIRSKQNLLPVFCGKNIIPRPKFLGGFWGAIPVHSVQGLKDEAISLEKMMESLGKKAAENIDYKLMSIDRSPNESCYSAGPVNLVLRRPEFTDMDALAALQAGYEREEVLPRGAQFYPAVSRLNTERLVSGEQILAAELNGHLVGKINTSALSFTRFQIGGVYVHPDYRGLGIASRMTAEFVRSLIAQGKGISLFVKKSNCAARSVYLHLGFQPVADYRISYY